MNNKKIRTVCIAVAALMLGAMALGALSSLLHRDPSVVLPDSKQEIPADPEAPGDTSATIHERYSFVVGTPSEQNYLTADSSAYNEKTSVRYADKAKSFVYKYSLKASGGIRQITWTSDLHGQVLLEVSTDGKTWAEVYRYEGSASDHGLTRIKRAFDLTKLIDTETVRTIWLRISDSYTESGFGGAISANEWVVLDVAYTRDGQELTPENFPIVVCECDDLTGFSGHPLNVETGHSLTGGVSIGGTISGAFATSGDAYLMQYISDETKDVSSMRYFNFYLYVSDASKLNGTDFALELGSAEGVDHCESEGRFVFSNLHDGWNLMQIPLSALVATQNDSATCESETCRDGLNPSAWKRFRLFSRNAMDAGDGLTILIDHVGFSDVLY